MEKMKLTFKEESAKEFVDELVTKIMETGFGVMGKSDLYDFILYLMNKYSEEHFLDTHSNFDNAVFLGISDTRVKNLKFDIDLKFKNTDPQERLCQYFEKISS